MDETEQGRPRRWRWRMHPSGCGNGVVRVVLVAEAGLLYVQQVWPRQRCAIDKGVLPAVTPLVHGVHGQCGRDIQLQRGSARGLPGVGGGGWLEWICSLDSDDPAFTRGAELRNLRPSLVLASCTVGADSFLQRPRISGIPELGRHQRTCVSGIGPRLVCQGEGTLQGEARPHSRRGPLEWPGGPERVQATLEGHDTASVV